MSNNPTTPDERIADAGLCSCGARIVRGLDDVGQLVSVDAPLVDAVTELIAYSKGRASFTLALAKPRGLTLTRRTRQQIKRKPAGFNRAHVVVEHDCADKGTS